jgi:hypothetical protein
MSEPAAEPIDQPDPDAEVTPDVPAEEQEPEEKADSRETDWKADAEKWKSLSRKHEREARANAEAARKYTEFEESQKTEQQRLADRLAAAEQERDDANRARARLVAAREHSIPSSLLDRIGGSSEEEINESAQTLAQEIEAEVARRLAAQPPPPAPEQAPLPARQRPVEALTPGAMPSSAAPEDGNAFLRRMAGRE